GATLLVNVSASPYERGKLARRRTRASALAAQAGVPMVYCNQVGGQDELIFDGGSFAVGSTGQLIAQGERFASGITWVDTASTDALQPPSEDIGDVCDALCLGLKDYMSKCGFTDVVMGLSGGIDSAVTCALAARALGPDRVVGLLMPSPWSSDHSVADAVALAENLGVEHYTVPIGPLMETYDGTLVEVMKGREPDVTEENIQARIRGNFLMAYSNKHGHLLLSTGNKSELAVGYCTMYGDMAGGLAVISDLPKMMVYELAHHLNADGILVPESTITKPPSAELRPGQMDSDSLPPYPVLDAIIEAYVEDGTSMDDIVAQG
ncbi:MAG: NAD(+) synthase, partial [Myxococcota bacterium]|nr:NAD(+) synthase [Myxococcota bacterium]